MARAERLLKNAEALRCWGYQALQGRSASGFLLKESEGPGGSGLKPSGAFTEHITFQSHFVQLSSYRLQNRSGWSAKTMGRDGLSGKFRAVNVKRISAT